MTKTPERRLRPIEEGLGSSLARWKNLIGQTQDSVVALDFDPKVHGPGHAKQLAEVIAEIEAAEADLRSLEEVSKAARAEAEYRAVLVNTWPPNRLLNLLAGLGSAIIGGGGAAFYLESGNRANPFWFVPALMLWCFGGLCLLMAFWGLADWERKKWDFFADQFAISEKYSPMSMKLPIGAVLLLGALAIAVLGMAYTSASFVWPTVTIGLLLGILVTLAAIRISAKFRRKLGMAD